MLEGKVGDFSLPEIFQLIALTKKTGTLRVVTPSQSGHVRFRDGEVCEAAADVRRLALGARLVASGLVDEDQLAAALEAKRDGGGEVLRLLLEHAAIDDGALHAFVREQIADAVADMLRFEDATFAFDTDEARGEPLIDVQVATDQLVSEGNQRLAEWDAIRQHVPSRETVFAVVPVPTATGGEVSVGADAWQILALVDGRRRVAEVVDLSGRSDFMTSKALAGLAARGLIELCGQGDGGPLSSLLARREVLRRLEELELSEIPPDPPSPAPATEHTEPEPANDHTADDTVPPAPSLEDRVPEPVDVDPDEAVEEVVAVDDPAEGDPAEGDPADGEPTGGDDQDGGATVPAPAVPAEIDRAQVARELAALGIDDTLVPPRPEQVPASVEALAGGDVDEQATGARKLVRDEDINRGLLLRLIDGVKGA